MISSVTVRATHGNCSVSISAYTTDARIFIDINGASCGFTTYYGTNMPTDESMRDTIAALKEAVEKL